MRPYFLSLACTTVFTSQLLAAPLADRPEYASIVQQGVTELFSLLGVEPGAIERKSLCEYSIPQPDTDVRRFIDFRVLNSVMAGGKSLTGTYTDDKANIVLAAGGLTPSDRLWCKIGGAEQNAFDRPYDCQGTLEILRVDVPQFLKARAAAKKIAEICNPAAEM